MLSIIVRMKLALYSDMTVYTSFGLGEFGKSE